MAKLSRATFPFFMTLSLLSSMTVAQDSATTTHDPPSSKDPTVSAGTALPPAAAAADPYGCQAPYSVPYDLPSPDHVGADAFAWQTFLGLNLAQSNLVDGQLVDGQPSWTSWTSTVDLINCNQTTAPATGTCIEGRYFPEACTEVEGYVNYPVIDQVGKVDDEVFGAVLKGLASHPVVAANGTFLRYQILISPPLNNWLIGQKLQRPETLQTLQSNMTSAVFLCSNSKVIGSNYQSTILKLAWMETLTMPTEAAAADREIFRQEVLVYTPSWRMSDGKASCVKKRMGLVGLHVARKTVSQPGWVWATFEHRANAPDCLALPPVGDASAGGPSKACPATVDRAWNLYATTCQADTQTGPCQRCNTPPTANGEGYSCTNAEDEKAYLEAKLAYGLRYQDWVDAGRQKNPPKAPSEPRSWCLDRPPATTAGLSRLCRQVAPGYYYPGVEAWDDTPPNKACQPAGSVWANYQLIGSQWSGADLSAGGACPNVQSKIWQDVAGKSEPVVNHAVIRPLLKELDGDDRQHRPFLANTSMESYERSNCMGCHSKATVEQSSEGKAAHLPSSTMEPRSPGSDFVYFLGIEVPAFEAQKVEPERSEAEGSTAGQSPP